MNAIKRSRRIRNSIDGRTCRLAIVANITATSHYYYWFGIKDVHQPGYNSFTELPLCFNDPLLLPHTICVTGATGFVGTAVVKRLLEKGYLVRALAREASWSKLPKHPNLTTIAGEALDVASIINALEGAEALVHLVGARRAQMKTTGLTYEDVDLGSVKIAVSAMKSRSLKRILLLSAGAIGNSEYVRVKKLAEEAVQFDGLDWTIFRPSFILGPGQRWPLLMAPFLNLGALLPGKLGDVARRARNITLAQLSNAIIWSLEHSESVGTICEVGCIREHGTSA